MEVQCTALENIPLFYSSAKVYFKHSKYPKNRQQRYYKGDNTFNMKKYVSVQVAFVVPRSIFFIEGHVVEVFFLYSIYS